MKTSNLMKRNEGMALMISMIFLVAMGLLATYITSRVINNARHVDKYIDFSNAFEGVEAAFAQAEAEVNMADQPGMLPEEIDGLVGIDPAYDPNGPIPQFGMPLINPLNITSRPEVQYFVYTFNWATDGIDNNGDGQIDLGPEATGYYSMYAFSRVARNNNASAFRTAEQVVQAVNVNVWQNSIFAGAGQGGNLINGNVSIHGSVHLLGDALGAGGVALAAMDLAGTSLIHNNYEGLSNALRAAIPPLPTTTFDGEVIETLNASLRVRNGLVGMSGNSEVGETHVFGNAYKETMDGVYVSDGWTGTDVDVNGDPQSVNSDNGWDEGYDLGNAVEFPTYADDGDDDHLAYYLELDPDPNVGLQQIYQGDMTIQNGSGSFYWNATTGTEVVAGSPGDGTMPQQADLNTDEFYVWFDDNTNILVINGRVPVNGDINMLRGNGGPNGTFNYEGKGSMLAYNGGGGGAGNIQLDASLITDDFPTNAIGLQAEADLLLGGSAQMDIMGGFYAQNRVAVDRQTTILGTIVGDRFDMGINVPDIYQVPALGSAWSPQSRMIGSNPVLFLFPVSWREMSVS